MNRRVFLAGTSALAITATMTSWRAAFGQSAFTPAESASLLRMVRDIFPHDTLDDPPYLAVVDQRDAAAADPGTHELITKGLALLDKAASGIWAEQKEDARITILETIESTPFFITVRVTALFGLYGNPAIWPALGYEGESYSKGGYVFRGFNDLTWLPEPES